jgi:hypothetical protein
MPSVLHILACLVLVWSLSAAERKAKAEAPDPSQLKTLMITRGEVLFSDRFTADTFAKTWAVHGGKWDVVDGALRSGDSPGGGHHPQYARRVTTRDCVVQFRFRIDGANWMGVSFTDKQHVLRIMIGKEHFEIVKMSGIGSTTKGERLDRQLMKWEPGRWYTMLIEVRGPEVLAQVDNQWVLYGSSDTFDLDRASFMLINGGSNAWFDDLTIWSGMADPALQKQWDKRRALVLQQKEKRK